MSGMSVKGPKGRLQSPTTEDVTPANTATTRRGSGPNESGLPLTGSSGQKVEGPPRPRTSLSRQADNPDVIELVQQSQTSGARQAKVADPETGSTHSSNELSPDVLALRDHHRVDRVPVDVARGMEEVRDAQIAEYAALMDAPRGLRARLGHVLRAGVAVTPEVLNLTVIACCVFGLTRGGGQVLGVNKTMDLLDGSRHTADLPDAAKQAIAAVPGVLMGGLFAGAGVLLAQVFASPLVTGAFRSATAPLAGNYKLDKVPVHAVVPDPSAFEPAGADADSAARQVKLTGVRDAQLEHVGRRRGLVEMAQANFGLDNWFATNAILMAFILFHGLRIGLTGTNSGPLVETFKTGAASALAGGAGQAAITLKKMFHTFEVATDTGRIEKRRVFYLKPNDPEWKGLSGNAFARQAQKAWRRLAADVKTAVENFHDHRPWGELAKFTGKQYVKHAGSVMLATAPVIALNAMEGQAHANKPDEFNDTMVKLFQAYATFWFALQVLLYQFPQFAAERKRVPDPRLPPAGPGPEAEAETPAVPPAGHGKAPEGTPAP